MTKYRRHYMKNDRLQPYQKSMEPFWRDSQMYSESVKHEFELKKLHFDAVCRFISWETKPQER